MAKTQKNSGRRVRPEFCLENHPMEETGLPPDGSYRLDAGGVVAVPFAPLPAPTVVFAPLLAPAALWVPPAGASASMLPAAPPCIWVLPIAPPRAGASDAAPCARTGPASSA